MKTEYHLEIYEPGDNSCVAASYQSNTPLATLCVGDTIHGGLLNLSDSQKNLRVISIQHILWTIEGSHTAHKVCVSTELA